MKQLTGASLKSFPVSGLAFVRDLDAFDGPLLSQYVHPHGDTYLHYWCDCDGNANRWMVFRISEANVLRLVNRFVPLDYVIPAACQDDFVYFLDVDAADSIEAVALVSLGSIPDDYKPKPGVYLAPGVHPENRRSFSVIIERGDWAPNILGDFPKKFDKVYSVLYGLNVLRFPDPPPAYPWRGGFSVMHFFDWALSQIPSEDRPFVSAVQYASPGFMRFSLHGSTANLVAQCVNEFKIDHNAVSIAYSKLSAYIWENRLNKVENSDDPIWPQHDEKLMSQARGLIAGFSAIDRDLFFRTFQRPFEAAKMAMAFYRNVRELAGFERDNLIRFPRTQS